MLVYLHQYREADTTEAVLSGGDVDPETDKKGYFDVEDLALEEWERVERDDRVLQRRAVEYDDVAAVSAPDRGGDDLPGRTLQVRTGGTSEYVENAVLLEAQDSDP